MEEPEKGLGRLLDVLKPGGFLRLSLYSKLSRQSVIAARKYIKDNNIEPTENGIRRFREEVFSGKHPEMFTLTKTNSGFYSTSHCRDLCFNYQEHQFTFKKLEEILISNKLKFLGFLLPLSIKSLYQNYFPEDKSQTNLKNWGEFERKHPGAFSTTPPFWTCKYDK